MAVFVCCTLYRLFDCFCFVSGEFFEVFSVEMVHYFFDIVGFIHQNDSSSFILFNDDNVVVFGEF